MFPQMEISPVGALQRHYRKQRTIIYFLRDCLYSEKNMYIAYSKIIIKNVLIIYSFLTQFIAVANRQIKWSTLCPKEFVIHVYIWWTGEEYGKWKNNGYKKNNSRGPLGLFCICQNNMTYKHKSVCMLY